MDPMAWIFTRRQGLSGSTGTGAAVPAIPRVRPNDLTRLNTLFMAPHVVSDNEKEEVGHVQEET